MMVTGQNASKGVEEVHCIKRRIDIDSNERGNNTLWSTLIFN